jgi:hypothetical protein
VTAPGQQTQRAASATAAQSAASDHHTIPAPMIGALIPADDKLDSWFSPALAK